VDRTCKELIPFVAVGYGRIHPPEQVKRNKETKAKPKSCRRMFVAATAVEGKGKGEVGEGTAAAVAAGVQRCWEMPETHVALHCCWQNADISQAIACHGFYSSKE